MSYKRLGEYLVELEFVSEKELKTAMATKSRWRQVLIGEDLVHMKVLGHSDLDRAIALQARLMADSQDDHPRRIGDLLVEEGFISHVELKNALVEQRRLRSLRIGEVMIELGSLTLTQIVKAIARQIQEQSENAA